MNKIEIPNDLRAEITAVADILPAYFSENGSLQKAALLADKVIKFYHQVLPQTFADHNHEFFRDRNHAMEIGRTTDAFECLTSLRTHSASLQTARATPENIGWLKNIFDCALSGQINLRVKTQAA